MPKKTLSSSYPPIASRYFRRARKLSQKALMAQASLQLQSNAQRGKRGSEVREKEATLPQIRAKINEIVVQPNENAKQKQSPNLEFTREELLTVSIWIKFSGLDFKYWSSKGLSKIGSLVGKPLTVDQNTERKNGLNFARLLVEVEMDSKLPEVVLFRNEKGQLVE
nr:uncharacterized protein LOC117278075 [Nicotiana tomentosiformis]